MKYNIKIDSLLTFFFNSEYIDLHVNQFEYVEEKGIEYYGIGTDKFWMWFAENNSGQLVDTIFGIGNGVNKILI